MYKKKHFVLNAFWYFTKKKKAAEAVGSSLRESAVGAAQTAAIQNK